MANHDNGRFSHWMSSGLLATIGWFVVLAIYCTFRAFGIEDPQLGGAFMLLTGAWVGILTAASAKKRAEVEEKVKKLEEVAKSEHPDIAGELDE